MRNLRLYMILFCVLVSLPLAFVAWRTYVALDREARAQVRFFAEQLLDEIEAELAELVRREESRSVDAYRRSQVGGDGVVSSPLAGLPEETYILGYFQNNPDGSFQTPLAARKMGDSSALGQRIRQLRSINAVFNQRKFVASDPEKAPARAAESKLVAKEEQSAFADRFLRRAERKKSNAALGQKQARLEEITADQALNLSPQEDQAYPRRAAADTAPEMEAGQRLASVYREPAATADTSGSAQEAVQGVRRTPPVAIDGRFQVEVAPLQAVAIDAEQIYIFRRIGVNGKIYRQGFVLQLDPFLNHLIAVYYASQPIARYTRLTLNAAGRSVSRDAAASSGHGTGGDWVAGRRFPAPFGFLDAEMRLVSLPPSPARETLTLALVILGVVMVAGLVTIYHSVRTVFDLSQRRSRFVSAVTHELKTPLTNIRMYIEMLDQGIAATPDREQAYFDILATESARLSGLIDNVLELSRLEKQTRRFERIDGDLSDVLAEVQSLMAEGLAREGFDLAVNAGSLPVFAYDRDVLVQVLINLIENSIKFGRHLPKKHILIAAEAQQGRVVLRVTDSGPGIPRRDLKHVFDDFYRADNALSHAAGGTGIGLTLVKKWIEAMGGRVKAENNDGPGCTISLSLPINR